MNTRLDTELLKKQITENKEIEVCFPVLNRDIQKDIHVFLTTLLEYYDRTDLMDTLYSILKELIINGVKANMKHHYFPAQDLDQMDEEDQQCLKSLLNEQELLRFEAESMKAGHCIILTVKHSENRLLFLITNSSPITTLEDRRIREKFETALHYDSIAEYYMEHADNIEGSGLGITMIVLMLKANNIDPHAFTVNTSHEDRTVARLEFPLKDDYALEREKNEESI